MTISSTQLETWTNQGAVQNSKRTYSSIQNAVEQDRYGLGREDFEHSYEIHLQGSYANDTNIYASSDVDVVVRVNMPFQEGLSDLSREERERFWDEYTDLDYEWENFYKRVKRSLRGYFGRENIDSSGKAIKIKSNDDTPIPLDADVVACADYRNYTYFGPDGTEEYTTGMFFRPGVGQPSIVNYSKVHRENGTKKNKDTNGRYKPTIRMFKNAREWSVRNEIAPENICSSYYLEGLLYNVPDELIDQNDLQDRYQDIVEWLKVADIGEFPEQSEMYPLCHPLESERWSVSNANATVNMFEQVWEAY
ncbi:nucleotidyltransferase domain-containing protein [Halorubrum sp. AS12]|uniref:nucleotidyltransferase domain-containing protein n=1 Tax=Halorubrum sp. AS12 TaxID=3409687 RepID=UPI003DA7724A